MAGWDEVKRLFAAALSRPESERESFLHNAERGQADVVRQVRELLAHHQTRTLFAAATPTTAGKPASTTNTHRRTSGLRTHWWNRRWVRWGLVGGLLLAGIGTALWLRALASRSLTESAAKTLATTARLTASFFENQIEDWRSQAQRLAVLYQDDLMRLIRQPNQQHRAGLDGQLSRLIRPESFAAWALFDSRGPLVAASAQFRPGLVASAATMGHFAELGNGQVVAYPSGRNRLVAEWEGEGELYPETILLSPVYGRGGAFRGVFALVKSARRDISVSAATQYGATGEVVLFAPDGLSLATPRFFPELVKAGLASPPRNPQALPVFYLRDPGRPLASGRQGDEDSWPETVPVRLTQAAMHARKPGDNDGPKFRALETYRDYRGHEVQGVWAYSPRYGVALVAKADRAEILEPLRYFDLAFGSLLLLALAAPAYFMLLGPGRLASDPYTGQFGPYTLLEKVGEGGSGEVYLASHSLLQRPAAVKILRRDRLTSPQLEQFEREVQLASHLRHPNTIEIYDFGVTVEGSPFCAMEYLAGHDLSYWVKRGGAMAPARVRHIARQIGGSLREAHAAGLLHRDLKPANIMLCELGGEVDFVKLLDFGLAKPVARPDEALTSPAALAGTPYYIAPERLEGRLPIDARSDFYSLGVLLYYLLTGAMPFRDNLSWVHATLSGELIPLASRGVRVPERLDRLVSQCLSRDPAGRPGAAGDLLEVLDQLETELPWTPHDAMNAWAALSPS